MTTKNFFALTSTMAIALGGLIYWREYRFREITSLVEVILWQLTIWTPWILGFKVLERANQKLNTNNEGFVALIACGIFWICLHFAWFFWVSSTFSPYREISQSRFGVFRYFFIFWTLIDVGLLVFALDRFRNKVTEENKEQPLFELTRGGNTFLCEPAQIHWLAAENYYTKLATSEGFFLMRKPLKSFQDVLPSNCFKKIHRSTIVNVNYVAKLSRSNNGTLELVLKDGTRRKVSRTFAKETLHYFKDRTY